MHQPRKFSGLKAQLESQTKSGGGGVFDFLHGGFEHSHEARKDGAEIVDAFVDLVDETVGADVDQLAVPLQEFLADGFLVGGWETAVALAGEKFAEDEGGEMPGVFRRVGLFQQWQG